MGELRLYAVGLREVQAVFGADPPLAGHLRDLARQALAPSATSSPRSGMLGLLGPIFRRVPAAPVISPTQPEPGDLEVLLAGAHPTPDRLGATWRLLETLVCGLAWGSTRLPLTTATLDALDFALARGGVTSAVGLRHLLTATTELPLTPVPGLTVGWHPYGVALAMAAAYRTAQAQLETAEQRDLVSALCGWLDTFPAWARAAAAAGRPAPDLIGCWAR